MAELVELADWEVEEVPCGNVHRHIIRFQGRQVLPAHEHNFSHAHAVFSGVIRCTLKDGERVVSVTDYRAGDFFEVPAKVGHQLECPTDEGAVGWCLFAVRDEDGGVVYEVTDRHIKDKFWHERRGGGDTN